MSKSILFYLSDRQVVKWQLNLKLMLKSPQAVLRCLCSAYLIPIEQIATQVSKVISTMM